MKTFSFSQINRQPGEVLDAALAEPVTLQKRGKDKLVLITVDAYQELLQARDEARVVHKISDAPELHIRNLEAGLEAILSDD